MISNAIISVYDKTNIHEFAQFLHDSKVTIYSTGGTYNILKKQGIPVKKIEDYTNFPEILGGRVKSLHPKIHAGILARKNLDVDIDDLKKHEMLTFDLVCVNLYPFEEFIKGSTPEKWKESLFFSQAIEMIDIGGPSMIRAAAKNHQFTIVLTHPNQYQKFISEFKSSGGECSISYRKKLAAQAFNLTASYDTKIDHFFTHILDIKDHDHLNISLKQEQKLRYGENPHQNAGFYTAIEGINKPWHQLHGKELSYNNLLDLDSALALAQDFDEPVCIILKHTNPCGVSIHSDQLISLERAILSDPVSCFGGIVLFNQPILEGTAKKLNDIFFEIIIAPKFDENILNILKNKKNVRLLNYNLEDSENLTLSKLQIITNQGGFLIQEKNRDVWVKENLEMVTQKTPNEEDIQELFFAWRLVKHIKSNAIVLSNNQQSLGIGAGQMSRIDAMQIAVSKAQKQKHNLKNSYLASDAFFPFQDVVNIAAKEGVKAIIQPGGSIRDEESIQAANKAGMIMLLTRIRHFRH